MYCMSPTCIKNLKELQKKIDSLFSCHSLSDLVVRHQRQEPPIMMARQLQFVTQPGETFRCAVICYQLAGWHLSRHYDLWTGGVPNVPRQHLSWQDHSHRMVYF